MAMSATVTEYRVFGWTVFSIVRQEFVEVAPDSDEDEEPDPGSTTTYPVSVGFVRDDMPTYHFVELE